MGAQAPDAVASTDPTAVPVEGDPSAIPPEDPTAPPTKEPKPKKSKKDEDPENPLIAGLRQVEEDRKAGTYRAVDWEPHEISLVTVPADPGVGLGRAQDNDAIPVVVRSVSQPAASAASEEDKSMSEQQATAAGAQAANVQVTDNGPGIPHEDQEHNFERFYRVHKDRSRETGGTGLGLSIVKNVVQAHGGTVSVRSHPGEGATFTVVLPVRQPKPVAPPPWSAAKKIATAGEDRG
jgi:hypothetical protein